VDVPKVPPLSAVTQLAGLLDSPEIAALVSELEATRWTGRPGYPIRGMIGMALAKSLYAVPTWTRTVALVREHVALRAAITGGTPVPSVYACYRFTTKLRANGDMLDRCLDRVTASLHAEHPDMGRDVAIDGSDMPAYANGQRYVSKNGPERKRFSDPDATWGHRSAVSTRKGGGYYGYKVHAAVCVVTGLPLAWTVETASAAETSFALGLIDATRERGFAVKTAIMDKGYDNGPIHHGCMDRGIYPVTPLRETERVKRGDHHAPTCEHGTGRSPGPTSSAALRSDVVRLASASLPQRGSRPTACTRSSRARRIAPRSSTVRVGRSSGSSAASSTTGLYSRCASVAWIGSGCTPT
jgi:hypothetical protein